MKKIIVFALFVFLVTYINAQVYNMENSNGQTISSCSAVFYDNDSGNYTANINQSITFQSNNTLNTHLKLSFSTFDIDPSDTLYIYDGTNISAPLIGKYNNLHPLSGVQNIVQSTITNLSGALTLKFVTNGSNQKTGWQASLVCIKPCQRVVASLNTLLTSPLPDSNYINVCLGNPIAFTATVTFPDNNLSYFQTKFNSTFQWDFGDNTAIVSGHAVNHVYTIGKGYDVKLTITDSMGCVNTNALGTRVRIASMPVSSIQPMEDLCTGNTKLLSAEYNPNAVFVLEPNGIQTSKQIFDSTLFIPDGPVCPPGVLTSAILFNNFPVDATIQSGSDILSICINIEHSFSGDLGFRIICPNSQSVIIDPNQHAGINGLGLWYEPDGIACLASANIQGIGWNYCWSEIYPNNGTLGSKKGTGPNPVDSTNTIFHTNYFLPANPLSGLIGCPLNGSWTLQITDDWGSDNGYLFNWSMELQNSLQYGGWSYNVKVDSVVFSGPFLTQLTDSTAIIAPLTGGNYTYNLSMIDEYGCDWDTNTNLTVVQTPQPHLSSDTSLCYPNTVILDPGNIATTYSWITPLGINISQSITTYSIYVLSPYPFNYIVAASNSNFSNTLSCTGKDTILVTVNRKPEPSFTTNLPGQTEGCAPLTISFYNESVPINSTYLWNFGDGQTSTVDSPTHIFAVGNYAISITATTPQGCSNSWFSNPGFIISSPLPSTPEITRNDNLFYSNAPNGNQWYNSSTGIIYGETSQFFTASQIGSYYVIVTLNGCSSAASNVISINYIGISEQSSVVFDLKVIPNPFTEKTSISYTLSKVENVALSIIDLTGKEIFRLVNEKQNMGKQTVVLNASQLSAGIYFYKLKTESETKVGKMVLKR